MKSTISGLEIFYKHKKSLYRGQNVALLCHPASVDSKYNHAVDLIASLDEIHLKAIFTPQHGYFGSLQDNMKEEGHFIHPDYKIPIYSLYSETRIPTKDMFDGIDMLIVDLQDIGTRVYTYINTVAYCLKVCSTVGVDVLILDRMNPIGRAIEGNILKDEYKSFVGEYPVPQRHGMTIGELALFYRDINNLDVNIEVIKVGNWYAKSLEKSCGMSFQVPPSPNMINLNEAILYPGMVLLEATNISEGRGTPLPFEIIGTPYINPKKIDFSQIKELTDCKIYFREICFKPTFHKWRDIDCFGFQLHPFCVNFLKSYRIVIYIIKEIYKNHKDSFSFRTPPYEYEYEKDPFLLLTGNEYIKNWIVSSSDFYDLDKYLLNEEANFSEIRKPYLLYDI